MFRFSRWTAGWFGFLLLALLFCPASGAQDKKEITVSPQVLQQYVGVYELAPGFRAMVTLEGNQLMVQATGQPKIPVYASSGTKFFYKVVEAEIEFFNNDKGVVDRLVLRQNQQEIPGSRVDESAWKEVKVSPDVLARYVGVYELAPAFNLTVTLEGNQLMTQASGQAKLPISASSETKFFSKLVDAQIEFFADDKGAVTHLVLHQNQQEFKGARTSAKVAERKEIAVPAASLAQYVGSYELQAGVNLVVTLEGDQLMAEAGKGGKTQLYPESETKFFIKVVDAQIEFFKNDKGVVTHLVLHQGANEVKADRK